MIYGVMDIGSNSVRLLLSDGKNALENKLVRVTQLSEKLALTNNLQKDAMERTIKTIEEFYKFAKEKGANKIFVFATECVRKAENKEVFLKALKEKGIIVDVIPKEMEAYIGFYGAYFGGKPCVMDIGGASTELAIGTKDNIQYKQSVDMGIVRLKDLCGENPEKLNELILCKQKEYGKIPDFDELIAIGGTAASYKAIELSLEEYDPSVIDYSKLYYKDIKEIVEKIHATKIEDRVKIKGMHPKRTDVIVCGGYLILKMMEMLKRDYLIIRESDNQEGYLKYKLGEIKTL